MVEGAPAAGNNDDPKPIRNQKLRYVFQPGRDHFPAKPYYEDGDPSMYTRENMSSREELSENPRVREAIMNFVQLQFQLVGSAKQCSKDEYCKKMMIAGQILRPGIDTDDLAKIIREDFDQDTQPRKKRKKKTEDDDEDQAQEPEEQEVEPPKNSEILTEEQLLDALFELADTWCPSINEDEYIEFFEILHQKMLYSTNQDSSAYDVLN